MAKQQASTFSGFDSPTAQRFPAWYRWGVVVLGASFVVFCIWYLQHSYGHLLEGVKARLSAMADDRQMAIQTWVGERWSDAKTIASYPTIQELLERPSPGTTAKSEEALLANLLPLLDQRVSVYRYLGITVIDSEGTVRANSAGAPPLEPDCFTVLRTAQPGSPSLWVHLHKHASGRPAISFCEPVFGAPGKDTLLGAVVVEVDPATWLYPALSREPTPTSTGECFIAERREDRLLFLSSLRHRPDPPCTHSIPLENVGPAVRAALQGAGGDGRFRDYRDEEVWLAARHIQGTPWALVTKIDWSEMLHPFYLRSSIALGLLASLLVLLFTATAALWRSMLTIHLTALMQQGERYRVLKDHAHEMMFFTASDGRLLEANLAAQEILGYSEEEFRRMNLRDLRATGSKPLVEEEMAAPGHKGGVVLESIFKRKDGSALPVEVSASVVDAGGMPLRFAVVRDITSRKQAEQALVASEEKYRLLADYTYDWESWIGEDGRFRYVSPSCERVSGYPAKAFYDDPTLILSIVHPLDRPRMERHYLVDLTGPESCDQLDFRILTNSGVEVWISHSCQAVYGKDGTFLGRRATNRDITPRKLAEERLRDSEEVFRSFFEANLVASYLATSEGQILDCNSAFLELFGLRSLEDAQSVSILDLFASPESCAAFLSSMEAGVPMRFIETGRRRIDGQFLTVLESASFLKDQAGKTRGFLGFLLDMTEHRRVDNDRRLLSAALAQAHDAVVVLDPRGRILYMNAAFEALTGKDHAEILTAPITRTLVPLDKDLPRKIRAALRSGQPWLGQITVPRQYLPPIILEAQFSSLPRRSAPALALGILRDVTEAEELKQELSKAQRLETFGRIASGVAHEVRNPLFAISTVVAALDRKAGGDPQLTPYMGHINDHVGRLSRLMEDLLSLGRPLDSARFTRCDLSAILDGTLDNIEAATPGSRGRFHLDLPKEPCTVMGDPSRLSQAFLNILSNALSFSLPEDPIEVALGHSAERYFIIVSNRGPTIPETLMPVLFDPFVTARKGGTGLGLAIVRQILAAHQATIAAENHPDGGGVSFQATFPAARRAEG